MVGCEYIRLNPGFWLLLTLAFCHRSMHIDMALCGYLLLETTCQLWRHPFRVSGHFLKVASRSASIVISLNATLWRHFNASNVPFTMTFCSASLDHHLLKKIMTIMKLNRLKWEADRRWRWRGRLGGLVFGWWRRLCRIWFWDRWMNLDRCASSFMLYLSIHAWPCTQLVDSLGTPPPLMRPFVYVGRPIVYITSCI